MSCYKISIGYRIYFTQKKEDSDDVFVFFGWKKSIFQSTKRKDWKCDIKIQCCQHYVNILLQYYVQGSLGHNLGPALIQSRGKTLITIFFLFLR